MPNPINYGALAGGLLGNSMVQPASSKEPSMAEIIAKIQQMQIQNGLRGVSPLGQGYDPMDNSPAPPGYRLNQVAPNMRVAADEKSVDPVPLLPSNPAFPVLGGPNYLYQPKPNTTVLPKKPGNTTVLPRKRK